MGFKQLYLVAVAPWFALSALAEEGSVDEELKNIVSRPEVVVHNARLLYPW